MSDSNVTEPALRNHPSRLIVETTSRCNLQCGMCVRQNTDSDIREGDLSMETFSALKGAFPVLEALVLSGIGEPLLHPDLETLIERARRLLPPDAWVGFQSNGVLLGEARAISLLEAGLNRICLSVDAVSGERFRRIREGADVGAVDAAFTALEKARRHVNGTDLQVGIEFVLMRENLAELPDTLRWAAARGVRFALVTQLLPYARDAIKRAAFDTNTQNAIEVFLNWKRRASAEGVDIRRYYDVFMKVFKKADEEQVFGYGEAMKTDAAEKGIALQMERLLGRDEAWFVEAQRTLEEARRIGADEGIELTLPELAPRNIRECEFVESGSAFVSWNGDVHPCYFLWHRYACYVGGWEKRVRPWSFGNLAERGLNEIWNADDFRSFRTEVRRYEFPFCFDCSFALCNYVDDEEFEQDCYTGRIPCGACLWCTGLFHCLR